MLKVGLVVLVLGVVGAFLFNQNPEDSGVANAPQNDKSETQNENEPPLKLKSIGINFEDFKFTKEKLEFGKLFLDYGFGKDKSNPQPTYVVPLGTPVRSIVDGVVAAIPTLWSGDYSVQVTKDGKMQKWVYEMEHLINPKVKVWDKVTAGQVVGEVSNFNKGAPPGYGAVEIGILKGGQKPQHICPFAYLDDSVKDDILQKIRDFYKSWEEYRGNKSLYPENYQIPGCLTLNPIEG